MGLTQETGRDGHQAEEAYTSDAAKDAATSQTVAADRMSADDSSETNTEEFQDGVKGVRAITATWTKTTLFSMFAMLYLISFTDTFILYIDSALNPYITSSFGAHGLLNIGSILANIIGACAPLPMAKAIDVWGRVEGFTFMMVIYLIGMIMKATCKTVEMYIGAHILYWVGFLGVSYVLEVMLADMTTLTNRAIIYGINQTPRIVATFAAPRIAELFYDEVNFRWAYGAFAIVVGTCSIPAMGTMVYMFRQAAKSGIIVKTRSERTVLASLKHYTISFDIFGILLLCAALSCILLPFSLAAYAPNYWSTPYIIAMEVVGVVMIPIFYVWEAKFAPVQFLPFKYLSQGIIIGSCLLNALVSLSTWVWNAYFGSYLQVVHRLSITNANYVLNSYSLTYAVFAPVIGFIISRTGNLKYTAYTGVPVMLLGTCLIIPFRASNTDPGLLAFTQILVGFGAALFSVTAQVAVMSPVSHQYIAVTYALQGMFGGIGSAIGYAIAGAIWNNILPVQLEKRLPASAKADAHTIFGDIVMQMSYADGSPERAAIIDSYAHVMRLMVIAGASFMPLCLASIYIWRNINVRKLEQEKGKQTRGNVF